MATCFVAMGSGTKTDLATGRILNLGGLLDAHEGLFRKLA